MSKPSPSPEAPLIGGRYRLLGALGSGSMGEVFRAEHHLTGQPVAIKLLHPHIAQAGGGVVRFLREVRAAHRVSHPAVVPVYDAGSHAGTLYIAMELLEGESLRARMQRGALAATDGLALLRSMLEPLASAHDVGIVHRDLKPDNVFLARDGEREVVRLLDFGIAADQTPGTATQTGYTVGTPYYMSPEQALDPRKCTPASDVWSVGAMIYELLTGHPPFDGATAHAVCVQAIYEPHVPVTTHDPSAHVGLATLVDRCLTKEASKRPQTARALATALDTILAVPALATLAPAAPTTSAPRRVVDTPPPRVVAVSAPPDPFDPASDPALSVPAFPLPEAPDAAARRPRWPLWIALAAMLVFAGLWLTDRPDAPAQPLAPPITPAVAHVHPDATPPRAAPTAVPDAAEPDAAVPDAAVPDAAPPRPTRAPRTKPRPRKRQPSPPVIAAAPASAPAPAAAPATAAAPVKMVARRIAPPSPPATRAPAPTAPPAPKPISKPKPATPVAKPKPAPFLTF